MKRIEIETALKLAKLKNLKRTISQLEIILEDYKTTKYNVYLNNNGWELAKVLNQEQVDDFIKKLEEQEEPEQIMIIKKLKDRDEPYYSTRKILKKRRKQ